MALVPNESSERQTRVTEKRKKEESTRKAKINKKRTCYTLLVGRERHTAEAGRCDADYPERRNISSLFNPSFSSMEQITYGRPVLLGNLFRKEAFVAW